MVRRNDILKLYKKLDKYQAKLAVQEPYWKRCSPCVNKGQCCIDSDTSIFYSEGRIIKEYITGLSESQKVILQDHINRDVRCPFRTDAGCIIHEVRPLVCRVTPYQAVLRRGDNSKIDYFLMNRDCTKQAPIEQDIVGKELVADFKSRAFVDLSIDYDGNVRKFLNKEYLSIKEETYAALLGENLMSAMGFLKQEYTSIFK